MSVYYNEWDSYCAQWLRNLIDAGHLPFGDVDERSITDVEPEELAGYTQHHFFAGIGGWAFAARLAGVSESERIVTGSPPCQPFSSAGRHRGYEDERHLAPHWIRLVAAIRPTWVFGEQVAAAIKKDDWLDDLLDVLEAEGYATGASVLPGCSVGAPHIRQRIWVVARLADADALRRQRQSWSRSEEEQRTAKLRGVSGLADASNRDGRPRLHDDASKRPQGDDKSARLCSDVRLADDARPGEAQAGWDNTDWLYCRDGKWRPVESGTFPLAHGLSGRVGRLRAYGNAIIPQVAAEVIKEALCNDRQ